MPSPVDDEEEESQAHGGATVGSFVDGEGTMDIETPPSTVVMENNALHKKMRLMVAKKK